MRRQTKLFVPEIEFHFGLCQCLGKMILLHRDQSAILDRHGVPIDHVREIFGAVDLPARLVWGGAGQLMEGDCHQVLQRSARRLELA